MHAPLAGRDVLGTKMPERIGVVGFGPEASILQLHTRVLRLARIITRRV